VLPPTGYILPLRVSVNKRQSGLLVAWNRLAENCNQFLTKGQRVYAEGRLHTRTWESQDGQRHSRTEIIANRVLFLDRQALAALPEERVEEAELEPKAEEAELEPEDIPF